MFDIPTARLKDRIAQLCEQYGIQFVELEPTKDFDNLSLLADVQISLTALVKQDWEKQQPLPVYR